jgi:RNA polymerase sigma factor (sigma-70 family)
MEGAPHQDPIAASFARGSPDAVRAVRGWIEPICRHRAWGGIDADEMVQESLLRLTEALRRGAFEQRSSFKTFACAVAKVTCLEARRCARREGANATQDPSESAGSAAGRGDSPEGALLHRERLSVLSHLVQSVSPDCRQLWRLVFERELSPKDIAARLQISPGAVRVRLHRCLRRARELAARTWLGPWLRGGWEGGR